jgi:hypothetical protein
MQRKPLLNNNHVESVNDYAASAKGGVTPDDFNLPSKRSTLVPRRGQTCAVGGCLAQWFEVRIQTAAAGTTHCLC